jgi:hypothetical protein
VKPVFEQLWKRKTPTRCVGTAMTGSIQAQVEIPVVKNGSKISPRKSLALDFQG